MGRSALEGILSVERYSQKIASKAENAGLSIPAVRERKVTGAPVLSTNMRGTFMEAGVSQDGMARHSFSECPPGKQEDELLSELCRVLTTLPWTNRCSSIGEATESIEAKCLVVPYSLLTEACGEDLSREEADKSMMFQGYVVEAKGLKVLVADIPNALVTADPEEVGVYTRVGNHLGVLLQSVDRNVVLCG